MSPRAQFCKRTECLRKRARGRKQVSRRAPAGVVVEMRAPEPAPEVTTVYAATLAALVEAGRHATPAGANALRMAARLDSADEDTGSALAAASKQHLAALEDALRGAARADDGVDELRARRARRVGA